MGVFLDNAEFLFERIFANAFQNRCSRYFCPPFSTFRNNIKNCNELKDKYPFLKSKVLMSLLVHVALVGSVKVCYHHGAFATAGAGRQKPFSYTVA